MKDVDRTYVESHFTQPEPINHNELKRLLIECFGEVFNVLEYGGWEEMEAAKMTIVRRISNAVLDGDDS